MSRIRLSRPRTRAAVSAIVLAVVVAIGPSARIVAGSAAPLAAPREIVARGEAEEVLRGPLRRLIPGQVSGLDRQAALEGLVTRGGPSETRIAVTIELDGSADAGRLSRLGRSGARVVNVGSKTVEAYVAPESLLSLASLPEVRSVRAIPQRRPSQVSLGVSLHGASAWQTNGLTGAGIKVGIIDGGFSGLLARVGSELPASIQVRCYTVVGSFSTDPATCDNGESHGTAVAETIADMAPGIELFIADPISQLDTLETVAWMTSSGVRIINASWASGNLFEGPGDGTSPYTNSAYALVDRAVTGGAFWVNSAGNEGELGWTGSWADADGDGILEWAGSDERNSLTLAAGEEVLVAIRWADPWRASSNDYDLELLQGPTVVASSNDRQTGAGDPYESIEFTAPAAGNFDISIRRIAGAPTTRMQMLAYTGRYASLRYQVSAGTLPAPADSASPGMVTVGAVNVASPETIEPYSSRGPTLDGRTKPDLVAIDCAATTILVVFCGTSQSAPYVTGAGALLLQADPTLTPARLGERLRSLAVPLGGPVPNPTYGWGRLALGPAPAAPAVGLAFAAPPTGAVSGAPLTGQPTIRLVDAGGATVSTGPSSTAVVTIALGSPIGANLSCDGGLSKPAVGGIVYFAGCAIDTVGTGYAISAAAPGLSTIESVPFEILAPGAPAPLAITASAPSITWSGDVTFGARLTTTISAAARPVEFQGSPDGVRWATVGLATTGAEGLTSLSSRPATTLWYRAFFAGAPDLPAATSYPVRVTVRERLTFNASVPPPRTIAVGRTVTFTSTVRPVLAAPPQAKVTFVIYRNVGTAWVLFRSVDVVADSSGRARLAWRFSLAGSWYVRSMAQATPTNASSVWSPVARYVVR